MKKRKNKKASRAGIIGIDWKRFEKIRLPRAELDKEIDKDIDNINAEIYVARLRQAAIARRRAEEAARIAHSLSPRSTIWLKTTSAGMRKRKQSKSAPPDVIRCPATRGNVIAALDEAIRTARIYTLGWKAMQKAKDKTDGLNAVRACALAWQLMQKAGTAALQVVRDSGVKADRPFYEWWDFNPNPANVFIKLKRRFLQFANQEKRKQKLLMPILPRPTLFSRAFTRFERDQSSHLVELKRPHSERPPPRERSPEAQAQIDAMTAFVYDRMGIRRLTPTERRRLRKFPFVVISEPR
jgi:hypothetical protein